MSPLIALSILLVAGPASVRAQYPYTPVSCGSQQYLGCFRDDGTQRDLSGLQGVAFVNAQATYSNNPFVLDTAMTVEMCCGICSQAGYPYFSVQYYGQCFCGSRYGRYGPAPESECNAACYGNALQKCGGWSNQNSVYRTAPAASDYSATRFKMVSAASLPRVTMASGNPQTAYWSRVATDQLACSAACYREPTCLACTFVRPLCYFLRMTAAPDVIAAKAAWIWIRG